MGQLNKLYMHSKICARCNNMVKNRVGKLETPQEHESFLRVMLGLVIVGLITPLLFKIITVAECIAIGVALVSIFIV